MPLDQAGEGRFGINPIARGELLQELPIRQPADRPRVEQARTDRKSTPLRLLAMG